MTFHAPSAKYFVLTAHNISSLQRALHFLTVSLPSLWESQKTCPGSWDFVTLKSAPDMQKKCLTILFSANCVTFFKHQHDKCDKFGLEERDRNVLKTLDFVWQIRIEPPHPTPFLLVVFEQVNTFFPLSVCCSWHSRSVVPFSVEWAWQKRIGNLSHFCSFYYAKTCAKCC